MFLFIEVQLIRINVAPTLLSSSCANSSLPSTFSSYDEDEDYESNIDILEQQLEDEGVSNGGELNEW